MTAVYTILVISGIISILLSVMLQRAVQSQVSASTVQRKALRAGYYVINGKGSPYRLQNDGTLEYWDSFTWKESSYTLPNLREHGKFIGSLGAEEA